MKGCFTPYKVLLYRCYQFL